MMPLPVLVFLFMLVPCTASAQSVGDRRLQCASTPMMLSVNHPAPTYPFPVYLQEYFCPAAGCYWGPSTTSTTVTASLGSNPLVATLTGITSVPTTLQTLWAGTSGAVAAFSCLILSVQGSGTTLHFTAPAVTACDTPSFTVGPSFHIAGVGGTIPQAQFRVISVDSQELVGGNGAATNAIDGNTTTFWHTQWFTAPPAPLPHTLILDLGASYAVNGFIYLPRQDGSPNGTIAHYQFFVSVDGSTWGTPVSDATFPANTSQKIASFSPATGRYVRLVALSEINGNPWTSAAEINVTAGGGGAGPAFQAGCGFTGPNCVSTEPPLATLFSTDFDGVPLNSPPSIGAYQAPPVVCGSGPLGRGHSPVDDPGSGVIR